MNKSARRHKKEELRDLYFELLVRCLPGHDRYCTVRKPTGTNTSTAYNNTAEAYATDSLQAYRPATQFRNYEESTIIILKLQQQS